MEIERINENTVKFYISYIDIEDRGFEREEIWYDRERSEQLFWQMMDEVNYKEDFNVDGPLWIQVQAMDKGLEITVTKAQLSKNGEDIELPLEHGAADEMTVDEKIENILEEKFGSKGQDEDDEIEEEGSLSLIAQFTEFEDIIQLSHYFQKEEELITKLFAYKERYFLYVEFPETMSDEKQEDMISQLFEFGDDSEMTIYLLEEYGKEVFAESALSQVQKYFSA